MNIFNLCKTAYNWIHNQEKWLHGEFNDMHAESVEEDVSSYSNTIIKAAKFFERNDNEIT